MTTPISSESSLPTPGGTEDTQCRGQKFRDIRHAVQTAAKTQNRNYNHIKSFSISFQADNTKADSDVRTFQQMARNHFRASSRLNCLIMLHRKASVQVGGLLHHIATRLATRGTERSFILLYCAGHGKINLHNTLRCFAAPGIDN